LIYAGESNELLNREKNYFQRKILDESWEMARKEKNTRLHLIKPMELELDLGKCIYNDDAVLAA
jgi:hypothetical protein